MNKNIMLSSIPLTEIKEMVRETLQETLPEYLQGMQKEKIEDKLLTRSEFKEMTGLSESTIYRHIRDGVLNCVRIGRRTFFKMSDILEMAENQSEKKKGGSYE